MTQRVRSAARSAARPRARERGRGDLTVRRARLRAVIEPVVRSAGYDLEELTVSRVGRRHVLRVIVDSDAGVNLDAVAEVSRALSKALDEAEKSGGELLAGEYQLEVSSPGVDRPLTEPRHWRRNVGRLVKVTVKAPGTVPTAEVPDGAEAGTGQLTGRILAADEEWVTLQLDTRTLRWRYPDLGPGRVQVEFSRLAGDDDGEPAGADDEPFDIDDLSDDELGGFEDMSDDDDVKGGDR